jgi:3',5'-cyclic AMP phosphodiesterase CpdA
MNRHHDIRPRFAPSGHYAFKAGTRVQVQHCASSYPLPQGLVPGEWVSILGFDAGYYSVEKDGRTFSVFMMNVADVPGPRQTVKSSATANRRSHNTLPSC